MNLNMTTEFDAYIQRRVATMDGAYCNHDWFWLKAQLQAESGLNPNAVSPVGARGLGQIMPKTWEEIVRELNWVKSSDPFNAELNIIATTHYMNKMHAAWTVPRHPIDRLCLAFASYNAGLGNIIKAQQVAKDAIPYYKIIAALPKVTGKYNAIQTIEYVERILTVYTNMVAYGPTGKSYV